MFRAIKHLDFHRMSTILALYRECGVQLVFPDLSERVNVKLILLSCLGLISNFSLRLWG